jgi:tRNA nucleotidyltransferase (CCA-adding enzyme)
VDLLESTIGVLSWWKYLFFKDEMETWTVYFLALGDSLSDDEFDDVIRRLSIVRAKRKDLRRQRQDVGHALGLFAKGMVTRPSQIVEALQKLHNEALLFMMAKTVRESTRKAVSEYFTRLRYLKPQLTGSDLLEMGYVPGPLFGEILRTLRNARLDGMVSSAPEERELVGKMHPVEPRQKPSVGR